jgi:hypothetical protein
MSTDSPAAASAIVPARSAPSCRSCEPLIPSARSVESSLDSRAAWRKSA